MFIFQFWNNLMFIFHFYFIYRYNKYIKLINEIFVKQKLDLEIMNNLT